MQFNCPLCSGLFEADTSLAEQQVQCPHCLNVVMLPAADPPIDVVDFVSASLAPSVPTRKIEPATDLAAKSFSDLTTPLGRTSQQGERRKLSPQAKRRRHLIRITILLSVGLLILVTIIAIFKRPS